MLANRHVMPAIYANPTRRRPADLWSYGTNPRFGVETRQIARLLALEGAIDVAGRESELVSQIGTVGHQAAEVVEGIDFQRKFRQALL